MDKLKNIRLFLLDMDGTIYLDNNLFDGVIDFLEHVKGIGGWNFPAGSTGLYSFGDGNWLISHSKNTPDGQCGYIYPYVWDGTHPFKCEIPIL